MLLSSNFPVCCAWPRPSVTMEARVQNVVAVITTISVTPHQHQHLTPTRAQTIIISSSPFYESCVNDLSVKLYNYGEGPYWLKAATTAFTFKTLLRHYAKWALTP